MDTPVHPRACGERAAIATAGCGSPGSSPRLRGTEARNVSECVRLRFIPAPAGNGRGDKAGHEGAAVHPRACGERLKAFGWQQPIVGSSPRLRGTVFFEFARILQERFIAGNMF